MQIFTLGELIGTDTNLYGYDNYDKLISAEATNDGKVTNYEYGGN